ncbi:MAG: DUF6756 family protein [Oscillospiraceae bacterium]
MNTQRSEIEECIKTLKIDRNRFFEVSKQSYSQIIAAIQNEFVDKSFNWNKEIHWANMGHFKPGLACIAKAIQNWSWVNKLPLILPSTALPVYVLFEDTLNLQPKYWLYQACPAELVLILNECALWGDFYIVSKKFDWLISLNHHDILYCVGTGLNTEAINNLD